MTESLRDLRMFAAVYEERSFTSAAAREHATQSGVSQHIRRLEDRLDVKLFSRGIGVAVQPTPAGDAYYRACVEVLRAHDNARRTVKAYGRGLDGQVTIGVVPTISRSSLAPTLVRFIDEHPNVVVRAVEGYSDTLIEGVKSGELDCAIVIETAGIVGLNMMPIVRTPEVLVSGRQLGLRHLQPLRVGQLGPVKMVLPLRSRTRRMNIESYFAMHGGVLQRQLDLDMTFGILQFIARTDWVTVFPSVMMVPNIEDGELCINPLVDPPLTLSLALVEPSRHALAPAAAAFVDALLAQTRLMVDQVAHLVSM